MTSGLPIIILQLVTSQPDSNLKQQDKGNSLHQLIFHQAVKSKNNTFTALTVSW